MWTILFLVISVLISAFPVRAAEKVILKVILNTEKRGDYFLLLTPDGDVLFPADGLKEIGFKKIPEGVEIEGKKLVSLRSLAPGVRFEIDEKGSAIRLTVDPQLLEKTWVNLAYKEPKNVLHTKENTAFLNYSLGYSMEENLGFTSLNFPWEFGVNVDSILAFSSFTYTKTETDQEWVRLMSNLTWDNPEKLNRLIVGDFSAFSGELGGRRFLRWDKPFEKLCHHPLFYQVSGVESLRDSADPFRC